MNAAAVTTLSLPSSDGATVFVRCWDGGAPPRAVVVIAHGVSEHGERYDRLGRALASYGYRTYAPDHRGHGRSAVAGRVGDAGPGGWAGILDDLYAVLERARSDAPGVPAFLLGHSMGAIVAQHFIALHGDELTGAVLSGTPTAFLGREELIAAAEGAARGAPDASSQLFLMMFAGFNDPFETVTGFEWLSRDAAEVRKYVDDPLSGNALTNATLADFLPGWAVASSEETRARVPRALPILLLSGEEDPVGDRGAAPRKLAESYRGHGVHDVTLELYPQARHEIFNETNRNDVVRDLAAWLDARTAAAKM